MGHMDRFERLYWINQYVPFFGVTYHRFLGCGITNFHDNETWTPHQVAEQLMDYLILHYFILTDKTSLKSQLLAIGISANSLVSVP